MYKFKLSEKYDAIYSIFYISLLKLWHLCDDQIY